MKTPNIITQTLMSPATPKQVSKSFDSKVYGSFNQVLKSEIVNSKKNEIITNKSVNHAIKMTPQNDKTSASSQANEEFTTDEVESLDEKKLEQQDLLQFVENIGQFSAPSQQKIDEKTTNSLRGNIDQEAALKSNGVTSATTPVNDQSYLAETTGIGASKNQEVSLPPPKENLTLGKESGAGNFTAAYVNQKESLQDTVKKVIENPNPPSNLSSMDAIAQAKDQQKIIEPNINNSEKNILTASTNMPTIGMKSPESSQRIAVTTPLSNPLQPLTDHETTTVFPRDTKTDLIIEPRSLYNNSNDSNNVEKNSNFSYATDSTLQEKNPATITNTNLTIPQLTMIATEQLKTTIQQGQINANLGSRAWENSVGQKVVWMVAGGEQSAQLTLNPPDLGPLQVVLSINNDQVDASFISSHLDVREALENALPKLREMMTDAGIQLSGFSVNSQASGQKNENQPSKRLIHESDMQKPDASSIDTSQRQVARTSKTQGLVDTFV